MDLAPPACRAVGWEDQAHSLPWASGVLGKAAAEGGASSLPPAQAFPGQLHLGQAVVA